MLVFKYIVPYVIDLGHVKANHGITLFIMSKKSLIDLKIFHRNLVDKKNMFNFQSHFEWFV